ncbi:MAG: hypothetical protein ACLP8S_15930 [Solirubrobacteraceae bacterium]
MSLKTTLPAVLGVALLASSASAFASPRTDTARIAAACSVGSGRGYGYTYLDKLAVKNTSCATGKNVARHKGRLSGWRCSKKVLDRSPVQYDAQMSCSSGGRRVNYTYTQNT